MLDCYQYGELSRLPQIKPIWEGGAYIPDSRDANGRNMLNEIVRMRPMGPFDVDSIMLYTSRGGTAPVMYLKVRQPDGQMRYDPIRECSHHGET